MSAVSLGGITIGYDDEGSGEPLVLVHGTTADHTRWRPLLPYLEPRWRAEIGAEVRVLDPYFYR